MKIALNYIIIALLLINFNTSYSQNEILIPEVTASRGEKILLPIIGTIQKSDLNEIKLLLFYDYFMLDIKEVITSDSYGMKSATFNKYFDNSINAYRIEIISSSVQEKVDDTICILRIEILAGSSEIAHITPDSLFLNVILDTATFKEGIIKITDPPVIKNYPEWLGTNYPNPVVNDITIFPFIIEKSSKVEFYFYNIGGRLVLSNEDYRNELKIYNIPEGADQKEKDINEILEPGNYKMEFYPKPIYFASGAYIIVMKTSNGVYYRNFMIVR